MSGAIDAFFAGDESGVGQLIANNMIRSDYIKRIVSIDNYTGWDESTLYDIPNGESRFRSGDISPVALSVLYNAGVLHRVINEGVHRPVGPTEAPGERTSDAVGKDIDKINNRLAEVNRLIDAARTKGGNELDIRSLESERRVLKAREQELLDEFDTLHVPGERERAAQETTTRKLIEAAEREREREREATERENQARRKSNEERLTEEHRQTEQRLQAERERQTEGRRAEEEWLSATTTQPTEEELHNTESMIKDLEERLQNAKSKKDDTVNARSRLIYEKTTFSPERNDAAEVTFKELQNNINTIDRQIAELDVKIADLDDVLVHYYEKRGIILEALERRHRASQSIPTAAPQSVLSTIRQSIPPTKPSGLSNPLGPEPPPPIKRLDLLSTGPSQTMQSIQPARRTPIQSTDSPIIPSLTGGGLMTDPKTANFFAALRGPPYPQFIQDYVIASKDGKKLSSLEEVKKDDTTIKIDDKKFLNDLPEITMTISGVPVPDVLRETYKWGYDKGERRIPVPPNVRPIYLKLLKDFAEIDCKKEPESKNQCPDFFPDLFEKSRVIELSSGKEWYYDKVKCDLYKLDDKGKKIYYAEYYKDQNEKCFNSYITGDTTDPACKSIYQCLLDEDASSLDQCLRVIKQQSEGNPNLFEIAEKDYSEIDPMVVKAFLKKFDFFVTGDDSRQYIKSYKQWENAFYANDKISKEAKEALQGNKKLRDYLQGLIALVKRNPVIIDNTLAVDESLRKRQYINPQKYAVNRTQVELNALMHVRPQRIPAIGRIPASNIAIARGSFRGGGPENPIYKDGSGSILKIVITRLENILRSQGLAIDSKDKVKINDAIEFLIKTENQIDMIFRRMIMVARHGMAIGLDRKNYKKETVSTANFFTNDAITDVEAARNFIKNQEKLLAEKYKALGEKQERCVSGIMLHTVPRIARFAQTRVPFI